MWLNDNGGAANMFQDFVVLGIIPGTNFQISFQLWLAAVCAGTAAYFAWENRATLHMELSILRIRLAILTHQLEIK